MLNHPLHLLAGRQRAVGITALAGVDEGLDAALDAEASTLLRALGGLSALTVAVIIDTQTPLHHLVLMAFSVVAANA